MAIFKCKMCGGDLNVAENTTVCECEYCGTKQTVPSADNEKKVNLFNRANRLRSGCEFDKAAGVYESIVAEFPEESEAYWGLCLCKYGIEYVDDPATGKKIPTCHRTSFDSIFDDNNFEMAQEYADYIARSVYRAEAKEIDRLQKEILEIAKNEEAFDVFICYKESDENGQRTVDSELAHDIYDVLTEKGYKVFYSRITLKAKLGQDYEPYIFSALNSAKVMLAIGTQYDYYNAVWVKNEWSRYLALMNNNKDKMLIPCYKDIDAYDMPSEFKHLQAQDLSSPRAFQDLVNVIEKLIPLNKAPVQAVVSAPISAPTVEPLIKRAFICLEDGQWQKADELCEQALNQEPENANAYLGKLCAELKVRKPFDLQKQQTAFDNNPNYQKAYKYGNKTLKNELTEYVKPVNRIIEFENKMQAAYRRYIAYDHSKQDFEIKSLDNDSQSKAYVFFWFVVIAAVELVTSLYAIFFNYIFEESSIVPIIVIGIIGGILCGALKIANDESNDLGCGSMIGICVVMSIGIIIVNLLFLNAFIAGRYIMLAASIILGIICIPLAKKSNSLGRTAALKQDEINNAENEIKNKFIKETDELFRLYSNVPSNIINKWHKDISDALDYRKNNK
ncbi:MAG: toll/interleukin-1 receptor domain-containing protein [Oscillospiraceae bacterium]|nr:toll/interleukin-1 receptor domain-containing protein [Oscillospiraceae bacterium]